MYTHINFINIYWQWNNWNNIIYLFKNEKPLPHNAEIGNARSLFGTNKEKSLKSFIYLVNQIGSTYVSTAAIIIIVASPRNFGNNTGQYL